jgi:hypothetical protein
MANGANSPPRARKARAHAQQHHDQVLDQGHLLVIEAELQQALVVVRTVGLEYLFAAREPAHDGERGIDIERREQQERNEHRNAGLEPRAGDGEPAKI